MLGLILVKLLVINPVLPNDPAKLTQLHYQITWLNAEFDWSSSYVGFGFGQVTGLVINPKLVIKPDISSPSS